MRPAPMALEPIGYGGGAEDAEEGSSGLLVAGGDGAPFFQARPEVLDEVAVGIGPGWAGHRCIGALGRDRGPRPCPRCAHGSRRRRSRGRPPPIPAHRAGSRAARLTRWLDAARPRTFPAVAAARTTPAEAPGQRPSALRGPPGPLSPIAPPIPVGRTLGCNPGHNVPGIRVARGNRPAASPPPHRLTRGTESQPRRTPARPIRRRERLTPGRIQPRAHTRAAPRRPP